MGQLMIACGIILAALTANISFFQFLFVQEIKLEDQKISRNHLGIVVSDMQLFLDNQGGVDALLLDPQSACTAPTSCLQGLDTSTQDFLIKKYLGRSAKMSSPLRESSWEEVTEIGAFYPADINPATCPAGASADACASIRPAVLVTVVVQDKLTGRALARLQRIMK